MSTSLNEVLSGDTTETAEVVETEDAPTGETETEVKDTTETVENDKTETTETAPPAENTVQQQIEALKADLESSNKKTNAFQKKAEDEVRKRQAIEQQTEKPDAYVEPDKAIQHAVDSVRGEMVGAFRAMQEQNARANHKDYDEKFSAFEKLAESNPSLLTQLASEFDPAEFVYQSAVQHEKLETVGDLDAYTEKIRTEERAKVLSELESKTKEAAEKVINDAIPTTLSDVTAAGGSGGHVYTGRTPLSDVLKR